MSETRSEIKQDQGSQNTRPPVPSESAPPPGTRRDFIKGLAAIGVAGTVAIAGTRAVAGNPGTDVTQPLNDGTGAEAVAQTGEVSAIGTGDSTITIGDIAAADKIAGRSYTDREREQMTRELGKLRDNLLTLRKGETDQLLAPAFHFDPRLPGTQFPATRANKNGRTIRVSTPPRIANFHPGSGIESLAFASATELSRLLRNRQVTSLQLTKMYLERLKKYGPRLLCTVNLTEELALEQAERADREIAEGQYRGPLHGIPWGAKDLLATRHYPTTWGAKPYEQQVFDYDATVVGRLEEAGAVLIAKLTMGELAMGDHWFGGVTRNPWNPTQGASGSSAGPGSATAAGLVGFSIGTETLGSIVSPSVRNGVTGLRPTFGRVSRYGAMPLSWTMDKIGPMCRGVEDCALVLNAIYGPDERDVTVADIAFNWNPTSSLRKLRIGIDKAVFDALFERALKPDAPAVLKAQAEAYEVALKTIQDLGGELTPVNLPGQRDLYSPIAWITIDVEGAAAFAQLTASGALDQLAQQSDYSWPNTFRIGSTIPACDYLKAMRLRTRLQQEMAAALKEVDCYVTIPFAGPTLVYTNLTGHPTLITRCGSVDGNPLSIEFVGNLYQEEAILRLGHAFERATSWHRQWPDPANLPTTPPELKSDN